jgi:hypothetical protein
VASGAAKAEAQARTVLTQMLIDKRGRIWENLSPDRQEIAREYAREQSAMAPNQTENIPAPKLKLSKRADQSQNLERQRARQVAENYSQARLEAPMDVTDSLL